MADDPKPVPTGDPPKPSLDASPSAAGAPAERPAPRDGEGATHSFSLKMESWMVDIAADLQAPAQPDADGDRAEPPAAVAATAPIALDPLESLEAREAPRSGGEAALEVGAGSAAAPTRSPSSPALPAAALEPAEPVSAASRRPPLEAAFRSSAAAPAASPVAHPAAAGRRRLVVIAIGAALVAVVAAWSLWGEQVRALLKI